MLSSSELSTYVLRFHLDALGFALIAFTACGSCHRLLRLKRADEHFTRFTWPVIALLVAAAFVLSNWLGGNLSGAAITPDSILVARVVALLLMAALGGTMLWSCVHLSLLRARLREHAAAELQLEKARSAADDASRAKGDFLAVMSHEIRTPLNAVMGFASLLADTKLDDAQRDYLATINREGRRLTSLINDILDLTKIEEGALTLERVPFAPVETASEVLRLLSPRAAEKKIDLRFEAQIAGPLLITGDPLRFRQILLNLIDNAIKFTAQGTVTLFLHWTPPARGESTGRLAVRVHDTGIGIAADKLKHLFQKFVQADPSTTRHYGGTGLGLAICHRLVGLMGGQISVQSVRGEGAEFSFVLPIATVAPPEEILPPSAEAREVPSRQLSILIVDDIETNRILLDVFLSRNGFKTEVASSGAEAVRLAGAKEYDAILMDLQMPEVDGFEATRQIRAAEPPGRRTPILALTACITKGTREKCLAAGMDDYLTKPLDLRKFKGLLHRSIAEASDSAKSVGGNDANTRK